MHPDAKAWATFYDKMLARTGLDLNLYKPNQLQRRILGMIDSKQMSDLGAFWTWLAASNDNIVWFMDKLAINVSELFRNPEKWAEMEKKVLPELLSRSPKLKIWSAGCSYGAEAHTLAVLLDANFAGNHTIVGSDIDQAALDQAKRGQFSDADMKCVPVPLRERYFMQVDGSWFARPEVKRYLTFKTQNLLRDRFDGGFDLIMCRNVVIYFTDEAKDKLYRNFFSALKPGGILFVGSTERIFQSKEIGFEPTLPFFYRKPHQGNRQWRNAS